MMKYSPFSISAVADWLFLHPHQHYYRLNLEWSCTTLDLHTNYIFIVVQWFVEDIELLLNYKIALQNYNTKRNTYNQWEMINLRSALRLASFILDCYLRPSSLPKDIYDLLHMNVPAIPFVFQGSVESRLPWTYKIFWLGYLLAQVIDCILEA